MGSESSMLLGDAPVSDDQVVCTLYEGDYHFGVAALINSIVKAGYEGLFWIGYRGDLPPWLTQLPLQKDGLYRLGKARLGFELLETTTHFTQFKPEFMDSIFERGIARKNLWYFDPDITVRCSWSFYERWVGFGVGLCQEMTMGFMPSNHPIRYEWIDLCRKQDWGDPVHQLDCYYNGGFVGLQIECRKFLDAWKAVLRLARTAGIAHDSLQHGTREDAFFSTDQDALNVAAMYAQVPLSTIGQEGMGWINGGFTMFHTVELKKPWRRKFLRDALAGSPPWKGDRHFLECAAGPIQPYTAWQMRGMRIASRCASLVGRFYSRR